MTIVSRILGTLARLPAPTARVVAAERDLPAKMSDGIVLLADRWHPVGVEDSQTPLILLRTPYGRRQWAGMIGQLFAERGYQVVIQSCRGTFGSGGEWVPFRHEQSDGHATLGWLAEQPWFPGRMATFGPSYLGLTQWAIAEDVPTGVEAMALAVTASDFRSAVVYPSGCFALGTSLSWMRLLAFQEQGWRAGQRGQRRAQRVMKVASRVLPVADADVATVGHPVPFYRDWLAHENPDDDWWKVVDFGRRLDRVPPVTLVGGWYDIFLPRQLDDYEALRQAGRRVRLTVGPWSHSSPGTMATSLRDALEWFDAIFEPRSAPPSTGVRIFVMGSRRWRRFPQWPPEAHESTWYLGGGGVLRPSLPADSPPDRYRYDPRDPTPGLGGASLDWRDSGPKDQRTRENRSDVLCYTSDVLREELTVIGPVQVDLHVRSSNENCDFFVRLCDVTRSGRSRNVSDGIVRLTPSSVTQAPDGSVAVRISLWPTANTFRPGHRIRLQVSSGAHPLYVRQTGTGEPLATGRRLEKADQEVLHDSLHGSCLRLPVISR